MLFSVANSVLLRPLPDRNPDRIIQVYDVFQATGGQITSHPRRPLNFEGRGCRRTSFQSSERNP